MNSSRFDRSPQQHKLRRVLFSSPLLLGVALAGAPAASLAQQDFTNLDLEALMSVVVITATQEATSPFKIPFAVTTRTAADIAQQQPRTFPQILDGIPGVMLQKTTYGQTSPFIRGFTGFRTLLLIDGVRLNNSTFRDGANQYWGTLDPYAFDQVELVAGPASVLYGSDSVGGTAQALTPVTDFEKLSPAWQASTQQRYATAEHSWVSRVAANGAIGSKTYARIGYTLSNFGDYRAGPATGRVPRSGYDQYAYDLKLEQLLSKQFRLTFAHQTFDQDDVWRIHSTMYGDTWEGTARGTDLQRSVSQNRQLSYVRLDADHLTGPIESAEVILSLHRQIERGTRIRSDGRRELSFTDVDSWGLQSHFHAPSALGKWTCGFTAYRDYVDSGQDRYLADGTFQRTDIQGPVADDSTYDTQGIYVQNQLPAFGPISFTARTRYDHAAADAGRILDPVTNGPARFTDSWQSLLGSLRAVYTIPGKSGLNYLLFAGASQAFRAPNLSDLSRLDSTGSGSIETPSTNVTPERYIMWEIGLKARSSQFDLTATLYRTDIDGMIIRRPTGQSVNGLSELTKLNSGNGYVQGAEIELRYAFSSSFSLRAAGTWMEGELGAYPTSATLQPIRESFSRTQPLTGLLTLRFTCPKKTCWVELTTVHVGRQNKLSSLDRADNERIPPAGTPGYSTWQLRGGWSFTPRFSVTAALENITDEDYRIHGSGTNELGRNLVLSAQLRF